MRAFACQSCARLVLFENTVCLHCGAELGLVWPDRELVVAAAPRCANEEIAACNWMVEEPGDLCFACGLTRTRPADEDVAGLAAFRRAEAAKRRLVFELGELGLPIEGHWRNEGGLAFDLLSSRVDAVTTGHAGGVVTLDLAEVDDPHRERMRHELGEPYRTVLGHLRHEIGHYYWPILAAGDETRARALFGDEGQDYGAALQRHYSEGPPAGWDERFVSAYASMHPAEDWAETFAHYLHLRDTLQTAAAYGVQVRGPDAVDQGPAAEQLASSPAPEPQGLREILEDWLPLTYALNALNRSMGRDDLYPLVLAPLVLDKLALAHELVTASAAETVAATEVRHSA